MDEINKPLEYSEDLIQSEKLNAPAHHWADSVKTEWKQEICESCEGLGYYTKCLACNASGWKLKSMRIEV